jgi:RNA polymerase sigma factor (sigma-70 family)
MSECGRITFAPSAAVLLTKVMRIVRHAKLKSAADEDDVVGEVMLHLVSRRAEAQPVDNWDAFLYTAVRRCIVNLIRRRSRRPREIALGADDDHGRPVAADIGSLVGFDADPAKRAEQAELIAVFFQTLSKRDQHVWRLLQQGYSPHEIRADVGMETDSGMRTTIFRLRQKLREFLDERGAL